jgi:hypothetical protein
MRKEVREGKTITVFDDVEEMKWHYHARLCKDSNDNVAVYMTKIYELSYYANNVLTVEEANKQLKLMGEPCEVKV